MRRRDAHRSRVDALAETDLDRRRGAPWTRRVATATIFAILSHLAILGLFLYVTPRFSPYAREARSISVDIVGPIQIRRLAPPRGPQPKRARAVASTAEPQQTNNESPPQTALAPPATQTPSTSPGPVDSAALGKALRGSVFGCAHADVANLSEVERQRCRDVFAANRADAPDLSQFAISPEKRAIFDAAWKADHSPQHMAGVICLARFGGGKLQWLHPSEGVKLGPLPCYVFTPKATFSADAPHARGWK